MNKRRLKVDKALLIEHAERNLEKARKHYEDQRESYQRRVVEAALKGRKKMDAIIRKLENARSVSAVSKAAHAGGYRYFFDPPSTPSKSEVCKWKQRLDWLKALRVDVVNLNEAEFSEYVQEAC